MFFCKDVCSHAFLISSSNQLFVNVFNTEKKKTIRNEQQSVTTHDLKMAESSLCKRMEAISEGQDVVCILYLEVKYCITGVNVYMDMNFVDKNLTDLSYLTAFFCIVNLSHCKRERVQIILAGTMCTFPISFYVCACACP